jgi:hypothetical protein
LVVAALALAACQPRTEMMIGVATDVRAPDILDQVELVVTRVADGMPEIDQQWDITGIPNEPFNLPGSYGIFSADGTEPKVQIEVIGLKNGNAVVTRHAILSLVSDRTLFVRMGLTAGCINKNDCGPSQTCVEGQCRDRLIDSRQLPDFVQVLVNELTCDSGTKYIDTATGDPMPFSADAMSCPSSLCSEGTCYKPPVDDGGTTFEPTDMAVDAAVGSDMTSPPADLVPAMLTCPGDVLGSTAVMMFSTTGVSGLTMDPLTGSPIWMESMTGDIRIGDPCTAGSSQLIANASNPQAPLIAGGMLYFSGVGSLFRTSISPGSTPQPMFDSGPIGYLAADATKLYYWSTTTLESAMIGGATINPLGTADPASPLVAIGGNFAFWYDKQSALDLSATPAVMKVNLSSTFTPVLVAPVTNGLGIVADNTNVYWTDSTAGLSMQPIAGGATQTILSSSVLSNAGRLILGPNNLIVTSATGEGDVILEVPPMPNATPTALATNTSLDTTNTFPKLSVGQHGVYWVDSAQQIWRAPALP